MTAAQYRKEYGSEGLLRKEVYRSLPNDFWRILRMRKLVIYPGPYHDFKEEVISLVYIILHNRSMIHVLCCKS